MTKLPPFAKLVIEGKLHGDRFPGPRHKSVRVRAVVNAEALTPAPMDHVERETAQPEDRALGIPSLSLSLLSEVAVESYGPDACGVPGWHKHHSEHQARAIRDALLTLGAFRLGSMLVEQVDTNNLDNIFTIDVGEFFTDVDLAERKWVR